MSFHPKWLIATRHKKKKRKKKKHGLVTCDGSAPHGAMSPSMSMSTSEREKRMIVSHDMLMSGDVRRIAAS